MNSTGQLEAGMLGLFGSLGWPEIVIILIAVLLLFGGKKIPELARGLAKGLKGFKEEMRGVANEVDDVKQAALEDKSEKPAASAQNEPDEKETKDEA
jgi:sec-independent protein translocase protein TatA